MLRSMLQCTECGAPIQGNAGLGLCSVCALQAAIDLADDPSQERNQSDDSTRFSDYELLDEIARGGMGVVYRARQRSLNRIVALKVLLGGAFAGSDGKRRLHAEAAAVARLKHPNIVAIHEAGELDGQPFFSMDFVEGETLAAIIRRGSIPIKRAARYVATVAGAIHYAHSQGVLHRDIKPSNVMIDASDQPRVTDFGLAKHLGSSIIDATFDSDLTQTGQVLGSPAYMPPEQALGRSQEMGAPSDVYSLGALLYEVLTGRPPFQGETPHAIIDQVKSVEPVSPRQLNGSIPKDLNTICLKCLEKQPSRRYSTAGEMAGDLERFLRGEPVQARPITALGKTWRWALRRPMVAVSSSVSIILLIAVAVVASISAARIRISRDEAQARLADSFVSEAHARRVAGEPGHRAAALAQVSEARRLDRSGRLRHRLRREAIAALARPDVRRVTVTNLPAAHDLMLMCFDPSFQSCAIWNEADKTLSIYRLADGQRLQKLDARRPDEIVTFSPDGRFLLLRYRSTVGIWDVNSGAVALSVAQSDAHGGFSSGAFSPDARLFGRSEVNGRFVIYELNPAAEVRVRQVTEWALPRKKRLGTVTWSTDGSAIALTTEDDFIVVCDARSGRVRWEAKRAGGHWGLTWNGPLQLLAAQARPDVIVLYNAVDGTEIRQINTPNDASATTAFSPDGMRVATCTERFGTRLFHTVTGRMLTADSSPAWHLQFENDGRRLGTLFDNERPAWLEWLPPIGMESLSAPVSSGDNQMLNFSPDGRWLLSLTREGPVIWDVARRQRAATIKIENAVYAVFAPDGQSIWADSGGSLFEVKLSSLLNSADGDSEEPPISRKISSGTGLWGIASCARRGLFAVADHKGHSIQILDQQARLLRLLGPLQFPGYVEFSPDGRWLACAADSQILIWDMDSIDKPVQRLPGGEPAPRFSPDSQWLLPLGRDLKLWRTGTWQPGPALPIASNNTSGAAAAFSPDGRWLAVTQNDRDIHLIDFTSRQTAGIFEGPGESRVLDVAFSPDGQILAAARERGEVQLWNLPAVRAELANLQLAW
jgi:eukaryotic-like serine/threonine-protein kinase